MVSLIEETNQEGLHCHELSTRQIKVSSFLMDQFAILFKHCGSFFKDKTYICGQQLVRHRPWYSKLDHLLVLISKHKKLFASRVASRANLFALLFIISYKSNWEFFSCCAMEEFLWLLVLPIWVETKASNK